MSFENFSDEQETKLKREWVDSLNTFSRLSSSFGKLTTAFWVIDRILIHIKNKEYSLEDVEKALKNLRKSCAMELQEVSRQEYPLQEELQ